MKTATICGSMRYYPDMLTKARDLSLEGYIVLMPFVVNKERSGEIVDLLFKMHREKIDKADLIVVVGRYIGESTKEEIEYAASKGKEIRLTHEVEDSPYPEGCTCGYPTFPGYSVKYHTYDCALKQ